MIKIFPITGFFFHFLFRIKETLKNWHFVNSLVSLPNTDFSSAKWPHQLFQIAYFSTFRTSQATNTGALVITKEINTRIWRMILRITVTSVNVMRLRLVAEVT